MTTVTPFDSRDPVNVAKGGTGNSSYTTGDILYATGATTLSKLAIGSDAQVLTVSSSLPSWQTGVSAPFDYETGFFMFDDLYCIDLAGTIGSLNVEVGGTSFGLVNSSSATRGTQTIQQISGKPGVIRIGTGTTTSGNCGYSSTASSSTAGIFLGGGAVVLSILMRIPTLSDGTDTFTVRVGLKSTNFTDANGLSFKYTHGTNSGNWQIIADDGTTTTANSNLAADTDWHLYTISVNAGATSASFYVDGVELNVSPLATDIPTATTIMPRASIVKSAGTTARNIDLDYFSLYGTLTNPRF